MSGKSSVSRDCNASAYCTSHRRTRVSPRSCSSKLFSILQFRREGLELERHVDLDQPCVGCAGYHPEIGAADVGNRVAPAHKIERVIHIHPGDETCSLVNVEAPAQRHSLALAGPATRPIQHSGCIAELETSRNGESARVEEPVRRRVEVSRVGLQVYGLSGNSVGSLARISQWAQVVRDSHAQWRPVIVLKESRELPPSSQAPANALTVQKALSSSKRQLVGEAGPENKRLPQSGDGHLSRRAKPILIRTGDESP